MPLRIIRVRHETVPTMNGCRWCGFPKVGHCRRWVPSKSWHTFVNPTDKQRRARWNVRTSR